MPNKVKNLLVITESTSLPSTQVRYSRAIFDNLPMRLNILNESDVRPFHIKSSDIVVFQRSSRAYTYLLFQLAVSLNKTTIYDIDDNLLLIPETSQFTNEKYAKEIIESYLSEVNCVVASTGLLKAFLDRYNNDIRIIPNSLPDSFFQEKQMPSNNNRLLISNSDYFKLTDSSDAFLDDLKRYLDAHENASITIVGSIKGIENHPLLNNYPGSINIETFIDSYDGYLRFLHDGQFSIALAALEASEFHSYKSCIKYLDFTSANIPAIFSNVPPYSTCIKDFETGLLVDNEKNQWHDAIVRLANDQALCVKLLNNARKDCLRKYSHTSVQPQWREISSHTFPPTATSPPFDAIIEDLSSRLTGMEHTIKRQETLIFEKDKIMARQDELIIEQDNRIKRLVQDSKN